MERTANGVLLTDNEIVELVYFMYETGYISREFHDKVHELKFEMEAFLDERFGRWESIEELVKKVRSENGRN